MNVIQHFRSCSSYWATICFYFINQPCALYIAFGTFFPHSVTWLLRNIFNSWKTVCTGIQVHALRMSIKLGFWGTLGECMVCSLVKPVFFVYCGMQRTVDRAPRPHLKKRMRLRLWLPKVRKVNQFMLATFTKSVILRRHVVRCKGLGGKYIFRQYFCFYHMFKTNFSGHTTKFGRGTKNLDPCPWMPRPVARGLVLRTKVAFTLTRVKYIAYSVQFACTVWLT